MLEWALDIDRAAFVFINARLANPVFDLIMPFITSDMLLRIGYALAMALILWKGDVRLRWMVLFSALALAISDQLSSALFKPMIGRIRPCHVLSDINLLVNCGGGYAMPSSHAANAFAQAAFFGGLVRQYRWSLIGIASVVALSRVFVGVHYPADILAGVLLGVAVGLLVAYTFQKIWTWKEMNRAIRD